MKSLRVSTKEPQLKKWACHKLECIADFVKSYAAARMEEKTYFIELFPNAAVIPCQVGQCHIENPMLQAYQASFAGFILVASDTKTAEKLEEELKTLNEKANIIIGSIISERVVRQLFDIVPRSAASFILIDPPGYRRLRWSLVRRLAEHGKDWQKHKPELLIMFPLEMALERNFLRPECQGSINRFYGNNLWQQIRQQRQEEKLGIDDIRQRLVELYTANVKKLGYRFVGSLVPPRFSNPPFYNVIWASDRDGRQEMLEKALMETRFLPCELFG